MNPRINALLLGVKKHSPTILSVSAVVGVVVTAYFSGKNTISAYKKLDGAKNKRLSKADKFKLIWKDYIPTTISVGLTSAAIIGSNNISLRRGVALTSLYAAADQSLSAMRKEMTRVIGERKAAIAEGNSHAAELESNKLSDNKVIFTGYGNYLCYEPLFGRYFESDYEKVRQQINNINQTLQNDMTVSMNYVYSELGLDPVEWGSEVGWNVDDGLIQVTYTSMLAEEGLYNHRPCLYINWVTRPQPLF